MKAKFSFLRKAAAVAAVGLALTACPGPQGEPGQDGPDPTPVRVINIDVEGNHVQMYRDQPITLAAAVDPVDATVQTLLWEFSDAASAQFVRLGDRQGLSMVTGSSVGITALAGGEARLLVTALGGGAEEVRTTVTITVTDFSTQIAELRALHAAGSLPAEFAIRTVTADEPIPPQELYFGGNPVAITLTGRGAGGDVLSLTDPGAMFTVGSGVTLVLENVTLRGIADNPGSALVVVEDGGSLRMNAGASVTGNTNTAIFADATGLANQGGGVRVLAGGEFILAGGEVSYNNAHRAGGVLNFGSFTMSSGVIRDNTITSVGMGPNLVTAWGGGVLNAFGATFEMTGGEISGNATNGFGFGGGVHNFGDFVMHDGTVIGNTAESGGGIIVHGGTFTLHDGLIAENVGSVVGGGVHILAIDGRGGTFVMNGGQILGNISEEGAGVRLLGQFDGQTQGSPQVPSFFTMNGGEISGNVAENGGGGVLNGGGTFVMNDGEIADNVAGWGGGVYIIQIALWGDAISGTFEMHSGTISGNVAIEQGGGAYIANGGIFRMRDGAIAGNAAGWGGGVYSAPGGVFHLHSGAVAGNIALMNGGGVLNEGGVGFTMRGGTISGNTASGMGGGVLNLSGTFQMGGGVVYGNESTLGEGLANAGSPGAALHNDLFIPDPNVAAPAFAFRGTFAGDVFDNLGNLPASTDSTLRVVDGVLQ